MVRDTDDGLDDFFEVRAGLNPRSAHSQGRTVWVWLPGAVNPTPVWIPGPHDALGDTDNDGLSNFLEQVYGTDPTLWDTDGDGVSDGDEVNQGSIPTDPGDGGQPPNPEDICRFRLTIGDHSGSHSERWQITVGDIPWPSWNAGQVVSQVFPFRRGASYSITIQHLGSILSSPDYDYTARVEVVGDCPCWSIDDPYTPPLLGVHDESNPNYAAGKTAWLHLPKIDLDIDSDNTNGFGAPDRADEQEDQIEDDPSRPGKIIVVNDSDSDGDGVPDFADGFNLNGIPGDADDQVPDLRFVPIVIQAGPVKPSEAANVRVKFTYAASDPAAVTVTPSPGGEGPPTYSPGPGRFRIWKKDGSAARNKLGAPSGDFIVSGQEYTLAQLGIDPQVGTATLYVEAVRPSATAGDDRILAEVTGPCAGEDAVRVTALEVGVHDLRHWGPGHAGGTAVVEYTDPDRSASLLQPRVGGAVTDGVSMCLLRCSPPLNGLPITFGIRRPPNEQLIAQPLILGALVPVARSGGLSSLPAVPMVGADTHWACEATSPDGLALFVPPPNYLDRTQHGFPGALEPGETTTIAFNLSIGGNLIGSVPFTLRRPPIVFVHGLFGSAHDYWGRQLADETAPAGPHAPQELGIPVPTRLYFADYGPLNTQGYDAVYHVVPQTIRRALQDYWNANDDIGTHAHWASPPSFQHVTQRGFRGIRYAATRVDVVGHSMGGQITRFYVSGVAANVPRLRMASPLNPWGPFVPMAFTDFISQPRRTGPVAPPAVEDYRWFYIRPDNYGCGDIRRFIAIASPFNGSPIGNLAATAFEPTPRKKARMNRARNFALGRGWQDPTARAFPSGNRDDAPEAFYDLATMSFPQRLMEGATPTSLHGVGTGASYPQGRAAVRWYPIAGRIFESGQVYGSALFGNELLRLLPVGDLSELGPGLSDSVVSIDSALNAPPMPAQATILDSHEHSSKPGSPYFGLNASSAVADEVRRLLSGPDTNLNTQGLDQ